MLILKLLSPELRSLKLRNSGNVCNKGSMLLAIFANVKHQKFLALWMAGICPSTLLVHCYYFPVSGLRTAVLPSIDDVSFL